MTELTTAELALLKAAVNEYADTFLPAFARYVRDDAALQAARASALSVGLKIRSELARRASEAQATADAETVQAVAKLVHKEKVA